MAECHDSAQVSLHVIHSVRDQKQQSELKIWITLKYFISYAFIFLIIFLLAVVCLCLIYFYVKQKEKKFRVKAPHFTQNTTDIQSLRSFCFMKYVNF